MALYNMLLKQNLLQIVEPYFVVEIKYVCIGSCLHVRRDVTRSPNLIMEWTCLFCLWLADTHTNLNYFFTKSDGTNLYVDRDNLDQLLTPPSKRRSLLCPTYS